MISHVSEPYAKQWEPYTVGHISLELVSRAEFERLKGEVQALKDLMAAAKRFDVETGQPDCDDEDKVGVIRRMAEMLGVDVADVLGAEAPA